MYINKSYDNWSKTYDTNVNKTRDLEATALQKTLMNIPFDTCLEIGCGTGKNTKWLISRAQSVLSIDFSSEMLAIAKNKIQSPKVDFKLADVTKKWTFASQKYDLISFSLILEHIENLEHVFKNLQEFTSLGGYVYIGELHPFKQYSGSKARFETEAGVQVLTCFTHHLSDFTNLAIQYGFEISSINEFFDDDDRTTIPRILTVVLRKV